MKIKDPIELQVIDPPRCRLSLRHRTRSVCRQRWWLGLLDLKFQLIINFDRLPLGKAKNSANSVSAEIRQRKRIYATDQSGKLGHLRMLDGTRTGPSQASWSCSSSSAIRGKADVQRTRSELPCLTHSRPNHNGEPPFHPVCGCSQQSDPGGAAAMGKTGTRVLDPAAQLNRVSCSLSSLLPPRTPVC